MIFARWALYASALGVMGGFGAAWIHPSALTRIVRVSRTAALALILSTPIVLIAQDYEWFGIGGITNVYNIWLIITKTLWGVHWTRLAFTAVGAWVLIAVTGTRRRLWFVASAVACVGVALGVPLVGHGGGHGFTTWLWHGAHVCGAGLWIGSLSVALVSGLANPPTLLSALRRFAPLAMTGAGVLASSGVILAWEHLDTVSLLWTSDYGQVLLFKLTAVIAVAALGFVNWRGPRLRVVIAEVVVAVLVVLSLTAWLSGVEPPDE